MCTWTGQRLAVDGHGKGPEEWIRVKSAAVYYNHPAQGTRDHVVVIDFWGDLGPPSARVALELSAASAAELARAIGRALASPQARQDLAAMTAKL